MRPPARTPLLVLAGLVLLASACSASTFAVQEPTSTPPAEGSALARLYELLDFVNNDNVASLYAALTPDVQQQITLEQLESAFHSVEEGTGGEINISIDQVHGQEEEGDLAEIEVTLRITAGTAVDFTLRQVAILQRIDGVWRLADHFLQTAFVALGVTNLEELQRQFDAEGCLLGDVLAGVYAPTRLQILDPCVTTSGTVYDLTNETDGDITFNLDVPPEDQHLLNDENRSRKGGKLHIEIIPADQGRLTPPANGDRVRVTGAWVLDSGHGWQEIHPVWTIEPLVEPAPQLPSTGYGPGSY